MTRWPYAKSNRIQKNISSILEQVRSPLTHELKEIVAALDYLLL